MRSHPLPTFALLLGLAVPAARAATPAEEAFEATVRPVLAERCLKCHGPEKQSAGLRVDSREALLAGGENGPALAPGDPANSLLMKAIRHDGDVQMPPKGKLDDPEVEALAAWVRAGAPWPSGTPTASTAAPEAWREHWAFRPVRRPMVPAVKNAGWVATPVDAYILAALEAKGLTPSESADKRTLLRRATYDLTGLPPTESEYAAFEADGTPDAYERRIERLLASPRYGERWGRHWLDVARYSDTKGDGFSGDRTYPHAFTYRDYVIRAFNEDLPYDRFLIEQLAADRLVTEQDTRPLAALGFLTLGPRFVNNKHEIIDDRIDVVTRGLLGLTVACARCHDHKFDPIPTEDYYALYGVFASSEEPAEEPEIRPAAPSPQIEAYRLELRVRKDAVAAYLEMKRAERRADLIKTLPAHLAGAVEVDSDSGHPRVDEVARAAQLYPPAFRLFVDRWGKRVRQARAGHDPVFTPWQDLASLPAEKFAPKAAELIRAWWGSPDPARPLNRPLLHALASAAPTSMKDVAAAYGRVFAEAEAARVAPAADPERDASAVLLDPFRGVEAGEVTAASDRAPLVALLEQVDGLFTLSPESARTLLNAFERLAFQGIKEKIAELDATHPGSPPRAMVLRDVAEPKDAPIFVRGNPKRPGKVAPRRAPRVFAASGERKPFADGSGRLELARAIADPANPLTARVLVNRVWLHHFGAGLVGTPSDFGTRSDAPTHPGLLDDLASRFVEGGWSIKALHRLIMRSNTYRQRGEDRPECREVDPGNRLVWRKAPRRLEFEALRDSLLAASGQLDPARGGRPVEIAKTPFSGRRTVYGLVDRQNLEGVYRAFDFASPETTSPQRHSTIVPQQALFLMNSPFVAEQARHLAARAGGSNPEDAIRKLYGAAFGRAPEPSEIALGARFLASRAIAPDPGPESAWISGYGEIDEKTGRVARFRPLPHWTGDTWQYGPKLPDGEAGYVSLHAAGGLPGPTAKFAAIRRWVSPRAAVVEVSGVLSHKVDVGDGVRARAVAGRSGVLGTWKVRNGEAGTAVARVEVTAGETLDFVIDCQGSHDGDFFSWAPTVRATDGGPGPASWDASADFLGPPEPFSPLEAYAQALLLLNEFMYVD